MNDKTLQLFLRIMRSPDGKELVEVLKRLSEMNYRAMKGCHVPEGLNYHRGFAIATDTLIEELEGCQNRLKKQEAAKTAPDNSGWGN
jgi:hypothetical protein